jgi:hypothetical protein
MFRLRTSQLQALRSLQMHKLLAQINTQLILAQKKYNTVRYFCVAACFYGNFVIKTG